MSMLLEANERYVLMRVTAGLKAIESPLAADFIALSERLDLLRHCDRCGNYGEHEGNTCAPCLDLEAMGDDAGDYVRSVQ